MRPETVARLNALNRQFYATVAEAFDQTRSSAWPGWQPLLAYLPVRRPLRVLDVGCGNGRLAVFLHRAGVAMDYVGVDNSPALLAAAHTALQPLPITRWQLWERDIVEQPLAEGEYDFIGVFGVVHHVPGSAQREQFLVGLARLLAAEGVLAYASWRFLDDPRLRARVVPWPPGLADDVEAGDMLLDWRQGAHALRYCHAVDDDEQQRLDAATGLALLARYRADGAGGRLNAYSVLRRNP